MDASQSGSTTPSARKINAGTAGSANQQQHQRHLDEIERQRAQGAIPKHRGVQMRTFRGEDSSE